MNTSCTYESLPKRVILTAVCAAVVLFRIWYSIGRILVLWRDTSSTVVILWQKISPSPGRPGSLREAGRRGLACSEQQSVCRYRSVNSAFGVFQRAWRLQSTDSETPTRPGFSTIYFQRQSIRLHTAHHHNIDLRRTLQAGGILSE